MKFNAQEATRFIGYVAGVLVGLGFVVYGLLNGDLTTAIAGATTLGIGGLAAPNVGKSTLKEEPAPFTKADLDEAGLVPLGASEFEEPVQVPTAGIDPATTAKHA